MPSFTNAACTSVWPEGGESPPLPAGSECTYVQCLPGSVAAWRRYRKELMTCSRFAWFPGISCMRITSHSAITLASASQCRSSVSRSSKSSPSTLASDHRSLSALKVMIRSSSGRRIGSGSALSRSSSSLASSSTSRSRPLSAARMCSLATVRRQRMRARACRNAARTCSARTSLRQRSETAAPAGVGASNAAVASAFAAAAARCFLRLRRSFFMRSTSRTSSVLARSTESAGAGSPRSARMRPCSSKSSAADRARSWASPRL